MKKLTMPSPHVRSRIVSGVALAAIVFVAIVLGALAAGYRPVVIQTGSMGETAPPMSLIIAMPRDADDIGVGEIVVMRRPGATPVTHRVIEVESAGPNRFAITQGDANEAPDAAPYPLEGEQLVSRWILPGWGGVLQSIFQPGIALGIVVLATVVLAFQTLRNIWTSPAPVNGIAGATSTATRPGAPTGSARPEQARPRPARKKRKRIVAAFFPLTGVMTVGVAWALFSSTGVVTSNDFTTAACFDAQLGSVQSGQTIHAVDGTVSVPITGVDPATAFVMASMRSASNEPADSAVQVGLGGGGTTIELSRSTDSGAPGPVTVSWSVIEYSCGISVQRGTTNGTGASQVDIAVSAVDPTTSFVLLSTASEGTATGFDGDDLFITELTSPTNLRIRTAGAAIDPLRTFDWQVVTFADSGDVDVQTISGTLPSGSDSTLAALASPVDPSTTFLLSNIATSSAGADISERMIRTNLADANTVRISRDPGPIDAVEYFVQVVTLKEGSTVQHGTIDFATSQPVRTVEIEPVDTARSTAISTVAIPGATGGGMTDFAADDIVGEGSATFVLTDAETVSIQRDSTASNASFGWQVIEWAGPAWWNPNYTFRQRIDVDTAAVAAPDAYTVPLTLDHAALVTSGLSQSDGSDLRVLRWDGASWTELDRVLDDASTFNQVDTTLWFKTTDPIAAASTSTYWLYFGNSTPALAFADPENVFLLTEDFESGTLGDFEDRTGNTGWYTADPWTRRVPITIPAGRVGSPLSDFPLLVSLTSADLAGNAQADGSDIRFTAGDGTTPLDHEVETWNSGTGELEAWVRIPNLSSASATTIYLYYGAGNAPSQDDVRGTWPDPFEAAWHLDRDPSGPAPQGDDSTVENHDGLSRGSMSSADLVSGVAGGALDFDGVDDMIETDPFDVIGASGLTLSGWVHLDSSTSDARIVTKANDPLDRIFELTVTSARAVRARLSLGGATQELESAPGVVSLAAWHHVASTWDGATLRLFLNGAEIANMPAAGVMDADTTMPVTIGGIATVDKQLDGRIDEVRIETVGRSAAWLAGAESNQRDPATFHVLGAVETGSWFGQGAWSLRKPVVVDASLVSADVSDFALLVQFVDPDVQAGANASGSDFVFTAADGTTRLDHVVETWNSATGSLSAWVLVPMLSSSTDTQLYLYYGNASASDAQDASGVFGPDADLAFLATQ